MKTQRRTIEVVFQDGSVVRETLLASMHNAALRIEEIIKLENKKWRSRTIIAGEVQGQLLIKGKLFL